MNSLIFRPITFYTLRKNYFFPLFLFFSFFIHSSFLKNRFRNTTFLVGICLLFYCFFPFFPFPVLEIDFYSVWSVRLYLLRNRVQKIICRLPLLQVVFIMGHCFWSRVHFTVNICDSCSRDLGYAACCNCALFPDYMGVLSKSVELARARPHICGHD